METEAGSGFRGAAHVTGADDSSPVDGAGAELFRLAIEAAPTGMIMVDQHGRVVMVNARVETLFGYPRESLLGQSIDVLVPTRSRASHADVRHGFVRAPLARPMGAGRDLFAVRSDGVELPVEIGLTPVVTAAGTYVLASVVDITERKRAQSAAEASLREKETLLREVHHRVKNNLQVISSLLKLHADRVADPIARTAFHDSQARVRSIALLHEKLYEAPHLTGINLDRYCHDLVQVLLRTQGEQASGVRVTVIAVDEICLSLDPALPCGLILNELVTNALKHAFSRPTGRRPQVRVELRRAGGAIELVVADNGVGLPPDYDIKSAKTLGTHLVRTLVRQLDGELSFDTTEGTRWSLRFLPGGAA